MCRAWTASKLSLLLVVLIFVSVGFAANCSDTPESVTFSGSFSYFYRFKTGKSSETYEYIYLNAEIGFEYDFFATSIPILPTPIEYFISKYSENPTPTNASFELSSALLESAKGQKVVTLVPDESDDEMECYVIGIRQREINGNNPLLKGLEFDEPLQVVQYDSDDSANMKCSEVSNYTVADVSGNYESDWMTAKSSDAVTDNSFIVEQNFLYNAVAYKPIQVSIFTDTKVSFFKSMSLIPTSYDLPISPSYFYNSVNNKNELSLVFVPQRSECWRFQNRIGLGVSDKYKFQVKEVQLGSGTCASKFTGILSEMNDTFTVNSQLQQLGRDTFHFSSSTSKLLEVKISSNTKDLFVNVYNTSNVEVEASARLNEQYLYISPGSSARFRTADSAACYTVYVSRFAEAQGEPEVATYTLTIGEFSETKRRRPDALLIGVIFGCGTFLIGVALYSLYRGRKKDDLKKPMLSQL